MPASGRPSAGSRSSAPPPGTSPTPISGLPNRALCRLAKRMSQASTNSLPMPRVRPQILANADHRSIAFDLQLFLLLVEGIARKVVDADDLTGDGGAGRAH